MLMLFSYYLFTLNNWGYQMSNSAMNPKPYCSQLVIVTACMLLLAGCGGGGGGGSTPATPPAPTPATIPPPPAPTSVAPVDDMPSGAIAPIALTTGFSAGTAASIVRPTTEVAPPSGDGTGNFRTVCDPIVFPRLPGRAHLHTFFGNTGANADSTTESLLESGNSSCRGGVVNRSAYWVPSMIDTRTNTAVMPTTSSFYYKSGYRGVRPQDIQPFPRGLRMIAGDPRHTSSNHVPGAWRYTCHNHNTEATTGPSIPNCSVGDDVRLEIFFPQCWTGRGPGGEENVDSPDHTSHMAYANGRGCPASHPVPLIEITFNIHYRITEANQAIHWRLSSDNYSGPAGYSAHGDWWNGWDETVMNSVVRNCINRAWDCHSHLLGDGRAIDDQ
jgi:hypothetical protein